MLSHYCDDSFSLNIVLFFFFILIISTQKKENNCTSNARRVVRCQKFMWAVKWRTPDVMAAAMATIKPHMWEGDKAEFKNQRPKKKEKEKRKNICQLPGVECGKWRPDDCNGWVDVKWLCLVCSSNLNYFADLIPELCVELQLHSIFHFFSNLANHRTNGGSVVLWYANVPKKKDESHVRHEGNG